MIRFVKQYEAKKPKQHPVGMTSCGYGGADDTEALLQSPADWISPSPARDDYKTNPPAATGAKVILSDTDHQWGVGGDRAWVWKSFTLWGRGGRESPHRSRLLRKRNTGGMNLPPHIFCDGKMC